MPVLTVTDLPRSLDLYRGVLGLRPAPGGDGQGGATARVTLESHGRRIVLEPVVDPGASRWAGDDLQVGIRHVAFKVDSVDRWADRVREAGMRFTMEPRDAFGAVRICFFLDPDGAQLELVQGTVRYSHPGSEALIDAERATPVPATPRFDHVAISVADRERAIGFYRSGAGAEVIGELFDLTEPRGFRITYLQAGPSVLEVFSFAVPTLPNPFTPGIASPGVGRIGMAGADPQAVWEGLRSAGALMREGSLFDPDGTPLEVLGPAGDGGATPPEGGPTA